ncbi:NAD-dependent aldehyde dehydrogenase [Exophiala aquamarina CBS 119918]|uniref:NAD-dependent aldehyde dehydrogenase n=1 Tax=Exophiala aquamarina CBS 119918 TaxID=1182545 RepID=A0A072PU71_9EURO|nr:NAD-dependent aldehyde dehydrogenase [Exophiala aquamarina CBS 119918]KEF62893.1 NAD-dependent aldehyde dehydrogenase [Exophiala aquamarina CBS 119918]
MVAPTTNGAKSQTYRFSADSIVPFWLEGKEIVTESTFDVISPLDQKVLYRCASASERDVDNAVSAAQKALDGWSNTKPKARQDIFLRAAEEFKRRRDEHRHYSYTETGAAEAMFGFEFNGAYDMFRTIAGLISVASESSSPVVDAAGSSALVIKEPYGVVLAIAPWNAPHVLGLRASLQPLAMGNTVVLKGPEAAPGTYWAIADVLHAAGLPAGCLNTIYHRPQDAPRITSALIAHPAVQKVNFTGSTAVGSIIASLAGKHLKPTVMELGGKAPAIVCDDADLQKAASQCALGAFLHAGQICMSTERIIVHATIAEEFQQVLRASVDHLFSDGTTPPPQLISQIPVEKNNKLLADAVSKGAKILYGDVNHDAISKTAMRPVVVGGVTLQMEIYQTESFGPTVALYIVSSDDEAIKLANDTDYGLSSAVFTEDLRRGLRIARRLESGAVHINSMSVHDESGLVHGGVKKSGFGRFNAMAGLAEWTRTKTVTWQD